MVRFLGPGPGAKGQGAQGTPGVKASEGLARESRKPQWAGHQRGAGRSPHGRQDPSPGRSVDSAPKLGPSTLAPWLYLLSLTEKQQCQKQRQEWPP